MLIIGMALLLVVMALLAFFGGQDDILGLEPTVFAGIASSGVLLLIWSGFFAERMRQDARNTLRDIAAWIGIFIIMVGFYAYRFTFQDIANRILAEVAPGMAISARSGEVVVARHNSGSFILSGEINGIAAQLLFDTGASSVVLNAATASKLGLKINDSDYTVAISTANGRTTAAPVKLERISIGQVTERNIEALVTRPGSLRENLLGMSFLERLSSYEVRDERLVLRQR
jgi:aspartyl protease family protein